MSFMRVDMRSAIETLVEVMLPRFSRDIGLMVTINARYAVYSKDGEDDKEIRQDIVFLIMRPCNFTQVYVQKGRTSCFGVRSETPIWKQVADHDSCWPSGIDTVLSKIHSESFEMLGREFPDVKVSEFISFSIFHKPTYVELEEHEKGCKPVNPKDRNDRTYEITVKREIKPEEVFKEVFRKQEVKT